MAMRTGKERGGGGVHEEVGEGWVRSGRMCELISQTEDVQPPIDTIGLILLPYMRLRKVFYFFMKGK